MELEHIYKLQSEHLRKKKNYGKFWKNGNSATIILLGVKTC